MVFLSTPCKPKTFTEGISDSSRWKATKLSRSPHHSYLFARFCSSSSRYPPEQRFLVNLYLNSITTCKARNYWIWSGILPIFLFFHFGIKMYAILNLPMHDINKENVFQHFENEQDYQRLSTIAVAKNCRLIHSPPTTKKRNKRNNLFRIFDIQKKLNKCNLILGKIGRLFPLPVVVI